MSNYQDINIKKPFISFTSFFASSPILSRLSPKTSLDHHPRPLYSILFFTKNKKKKIGTLEIKYCNINIKQYSKVTYLGCELDENLSRAAMALKVINKISSRLRFLYRKNRYLSPYLKRLLCNAIIQPHFDYACSAWYPNLNKKFNSKLQTMLSKCVRFCLQLDSRSHIWIKEFEQINWLPVSERFNQRTFSNAFKFFNEHCPLYLYDLYNHLDKIK